MYLRFSFAGSNWHLVPLPFSIQLFCGWLLVCPFVLAKSCLSYNHFSPTIFPQSFHHLCDHHLFWLAWTVGYTTQHWAHNSRWYCHIWSGSVFFCVRAGKCIKAGIVHVYLAQTIIEHEVHYRAYWYIFIFLQFSYFLRDKSLFYTQLTALL